MAARRPRNGRGELSATEAARSFSEILNRVHYRHETVRVRRGGEIVCEIAPAYGDPSFTGADLAALLRELPRPGAPFLDAVDEGVREQPPAEDPRWRR